MSYTETAGMFTQAAKEHRDEAVALLAQAEEYANADGGTLYGITAAAAAAHALVAVSAELACIDNTLWMLNNTIENHG